MLEMKPRFTGVAMAALLVVAAGHPGYAEDATASKTPPTPTAAQTGAPPASLPRPSLAPDILSVQFPTPAPLTGCGLSRMSLIFVASTTWVRGF